jgi:hypothetical protein
VYDAAGRYVIAEDDESRWLVGERTTSHGPQPRAGGADSSRRLARVSSGDDELPLGEDAIELVSEPANATADLTESVRTLRSVPEDLPISADHADADWIVTQASERPAQSREAEAESSEDEASDDSKPAKKKGRASVPSWDEIMFGSGGRD